MKSTNWLFFGVKNVWFRGGVFLCLSIWAALLIGWMYHNQFVADPYNPQLTGTKIYGHNGAGSFKASGILTLIEYLVLLATLLPFSFSRYYWVRLLVLQFLFGFWLLVMTGGAMHGGGVQMRHLLWLFGVNVFIFILLVASIIAEVGNAAQVRAIQNQQWNNRPNN